MSVVLRGLGKRRLKESRDFPGAANEDPFGVVDELLTGPGVVEPNHVVGFEVETEDPARSGGVFPEKAAERLVGRGGLGGQAELHEPF